jgi:hypothetical protein
MIEENRQNKTSLSFYLSSQLKFWGPLDYPHGLPNEAKKTKTVNIIQSEEDIFKVCQNVGMPCLKPKSQLHILHCVCAGRLIRSRPWSCALWLSRSRSVRRHFKQSRIFFFVLCPQRRHLDIISTRQDPVLPHSRLLAPQSGSTSDNTTVWYTELLGFRTLSIIRILNN